MSKESNRSNHVVANFNGGWSVRREGSDRAQRVFNTQKEAIEYARNLSKKERNDLIVHSKNGRIQSKNSYGNDPKLSKASRKRKR